MSTMRWRCVVGNEVAIAATTYRVGPTLFVCALKPTRQRRRNRQRQRKVRRNGVGSDICGTSSKGRQVGDRRAGEQTLRALAFSLQVAGSSPAKLAVRSLARPPAWLARACAGPGELRWRRALRFSRTVRSCAAANFSRLADIFSDESSKL